MTARNPILPLARLLKAVRPLALGVAVIRPLDTNRKATPH